MGTLDSHDNLYVKKCIDFVKEGTAPKITIRVGFGSCC